MARTITWDELRDLAGFEAEKDDHRILAIAADGRCASARIDGPVRLSDDAADVLALGPGAHVTLTDSASGGNRRADVRGSASGTTPHRRADVTRPNAASPAPLYVIDGAIVGPDTGTTVSPDAVEHHYFVDGRERPWEEGQAWYAATLSELVRETAYDAGARVARLRAAQGVAGVLAEIRTLRNGHARRDYFDALLNSGSLSAVEARTALDLANSSLTTGDDRDRIVARLRAF